MTEIDMQKNNINQKIVRKAYNGEVKLVNLSEKQKETMRITGFKKVVDSGQESVN